MIAILVLAAGRSRRFGRPKQLETLAGESLLKRAVRAATATALGTVYVVVDAAERAVLDEARRLSCMVVLNEEAEEGMASSIRAGVRAIEAVAEAALVMTCDQPAVSSAHLCRLAKEAGGAVLASQYDGRRGVPAYFPASVFGQLLKLRGDAGARELLREAHAIALENGGMDVDTQEDLERARGVFGGGQG